MDGSRIRWPNNLKILDILATPDVFYIAFELLVFLLLKPVRGINTITCAVQIESSSSLNTWRKRQQQFADSKSHENC